MRCCLAAQQSTSAIRTSLPRHSSTSAVLDSSRVVNGRIDIGSFEVQTQTVAIDLRALGRKVGGINTVRLTWTGATSNNVDVDRNGVVIATVPNTGAYTDSTGDTGRARYTYKVCEAGTSNCSNEVTVRFRH